jgi:thiol-disulfide isomerase/thioredoxin
MASQYGNFNAISKTPNFIPLGGQTNTGSYMSAITNTFSNTSGTTFVIILTILLFLLLSGLYYYYYIAPEMEAKYKPNNEKIVKDGSTGQTAELLFFYANWCPHCKAAKPIWTELETEYENKTINGYKIIFTEIDCTEETAEVDKMMNQYNVEGYPTIKLLKDGQVIEYDAKPTKATLVQFLNTVL